MNSKSYVAQARAAAEMLREKRGIHLIDLERVYEHWLVEEAQITSVTNYLSYMRSLDKEVLRSQQAMMLQNGDYLVEMQEAIHREQKQTLERVCTKMDQYLTDCIEKPESRPSFSERKEASYRDLRSGWRKFCEFMHWLYEQSVVEGMSQATQEALTPGVAFSFKKWLWEEESFTEDSASSYASRLRNIQKELFDKKGFVGITDKLQAMALTAPEKALIVVENLLNYVEIEREWGMPVTGWNAHVASNSVSTFRKYRQFIEFITETPREDEEWKADFDAMATECPVSAEEVAEVETQTGVTDRFGIDLLYSNFSQRLLTQERMSQRAQVWFPIKKINQLFGKNTYGEVFKNYLNRWCRESLHQVQVHTEDGTHALIEVEWLLLLEDGSVEVRLDNGKQTRLLTHNKAGELVPMEAHSLREITLEHQPSIAQFLHDSRDQLRGLPRLTSILKEKQGDYSEEVVEDLMLDIVFDLDFIVRNVGIELMQDKYNITTGRVDQD